MIERRVLKVGFVPALYTTRRSPFSSYSITTIVSLPSDSCRVDVRSRVGGRRGTIASPFSTSPLRTRRDRFRVTSLSSGHACHPKAASDIQCHSGSPHLAYRMATASRPPVPLRPVDDLLVLPGRSLLLRREVGGQVLMTQEHQPPPPEPDVRLVTASGSHEISYVFLIRTGCMPDQRDVFHRSHLDGSSDGIGYRQEFVFGSTVGGWR